MRFSPIPDLVDKHVVVDLSVLRHQIGLAVAVQVADRERPERAIHLVGLRRRERKRDAARRGGARHDPEHQRNGDAGEKDGGLGSAEHAAHTLDLRSMLRVSGSPRLQMIASPILEV